MKLQKTVFMAALLLVAYHASASPITTNGDFHTGDFTDWIKTGNAQVQPSLGQDNLYGAIPPPATHHAILGSGTLVSGELLGGTAVSTSSLESFLGLGNGQLAIENGGVAGSGSAIKLQSTFAAAAGSQLSFNWNFFNNPDPALSPQDMAFVILDNTFKVLANTHSPLIQSNVNGFFDMTGYQPIVLNILSSGDHHTLSFGIVDGGTPIPSGSALALTNVQVNAVPLPAACWLFLSGMVGLFKYSCQSKRA